VALFLSAKEFELPGLLGGLACVRDSTYIRRNMALFAICFLFTRFTIGDFWWFFSYVLVFKLSCAVCSSTYFTEL